MEERQERSELANGRARGARRRGGAGKVGGKVSGEAELSIKVTWGPRAGRAELRRRACGACAPPSSACDGPAAVRQLRRGSGIARMAPRTALCLAPRIARTASHTAPLLAPPHTARRSALAVRRAALLVGRATAAGPWHLLTMRHGKRRE